MKILILGKNGQVGGELKPMLAPLGEVVLTDRQSIDLSNVDAMRERIRAIAPDAIVNAAAYTAVDKAESEPELAMTVNGEAPGAIAEEAAKLGAAVIHYSTDYVFDGESDRPYVEADPTHPINEYGKTKLAGEQAIQNSDAAHVILRTSWVYGTRGKNFLLTIARLAQERDRLTIVSDQVGCPTSAVAIAEATRDLIAKYAESENFASALAPHSGLYHFSSDGVASWHEFARAIVDRMDWSGDRAKPAVEPIPTEAYPTPAKRPKYSVLSKAKFADTFGIAVPHWTDSLNRVMAAR
ncbi:MAG: dTDP-4-dehydrorhamnose reductase [Cyanobacteria bacterium J06639_1]